MTLEMTRTCGWGRRRRWVMCCADACDVSDDDAYGDKRTRMDDDDDDDDEDDR
jgi:hypothetical protein